MTPLQSVNSCEFVERMGELEEHPPHLLAIGVLSAGPNRDRRDAIRETWAQWPSDLRHTVRFFIGQPDNAALMKSLDEEVRLFN